MQDKFLNEKQGGGNVLKGQSSGGDIRKYFSLSKVPTQADKPDSQGKTSDEEGLGVDRSQGRLVMGSQQNGGIEGSNQRGGIAGSSQQGGIAGRNHRAGIAPALKHPRGKPTGKGNLPAPADLGAMNLYLRREPSLHQDAPTVIASLPGGSQPTATATARFPAQAPSSQRSAPPSMGVIDLTSDNEEEASPRVTAPPQRGVGCPASPVEDVWHYSPDNSEPPTTEKSKHQERNGQRTGSQDSPTLHHAELSHGSRGGKDLGIEAPCHDPLQGPFPGSSSVCGVLSKSSYIAALSPTKRTLLENDIGAGPSYVTHSIDESPAKKKLPPPMMHRQQAIDKGFHDAVDLTCDDSPVVTKVVPASSLGRK